MLILSIDIGITNMGYVYSSLEFNNDFTGSRIKNLIINSNYNKELVQNNVCILKCNKVDITKMKHKFVKRECCKLFHDNCIPDYVDHFVQENQELFEKAELILLERQPPVGITNVQDLLFKQFRHKVLLISPNSVHKYFNLSKEYSVRKEQSEKISNSYLCNFENFKNNIRKHDISDALLMIIYYYKIETDRLINNTVFKPEITLFEEFKFKP
jgi:hypothetical protein